MEEALASFIRLSCALVGDDPLPMDLAALYFEQSRRALADELTTLLARFGELSQRSVADAAVIVRQLLDDPRCGPSSRLVLALWFNGGIKNAAGDWAPASADGYYRALVWDVIGAHPPGLSNGYFGHWKYPPER